MSTPHRHLPPASVRERAACMCVHGDSCSTFAPGHALHLIQARLASATPSEWVDAIVDSTDAAAGVLVLRTLDGSERIELWSGSGAAQAASPGTPVALHGRYDVLAAGPLRFNVAVSRINAAQRR
ncbi:hypothetical protein NQ152_07780 [Microbacterium sp. zg.B48]|uniref:hypothetical protein n=1 Tax=Microbacterium sp. zg.B48 TaxID=2969408 RepID=UPI00214A98D9|nr:hypothetical protein [Microbacterium sp. zg.B48]MCR2763409.1 hypothetical protein [Microbacterium sp. zg.B48]